MVHFNFVSDIEDKGIYDSVDNEILVNLSKHESLYDLYDTIEHEYLHFILEDEEMSVYKEHKIIKRLSWFKDDII